MTEEDSGIGNIADHSPSLMTATKFGRRRALQSILITSISVLSISQHVRAEDSVDDNNNGIMTLQLSSPNSRLGLELTQVPFGSDGRKVLAIKSVTPNGVAASSKTTRIGPGMILPDFESAEALIDRMRIGPYPMDLRIQNLAAGGDAVGDLGKTIVTPQDALRLLGRATDKSKTNEFRTQVTRRPFTACRIQSRRGDVLEIHYEAQFQIMSEDMGSKLMTFDSSLQRGTGQPYQMVLGSGDMIPGVDMGLYDMCPGERRILDIPPPLGYGNRGSKLYRIPPNVRLVWTVELVSVNSMKEGDERTRDEVEGRFAY